MDIFINGVRLIENHDYVVDGESVTFTEHPMIGDLINFQGGGASYIVNATGATRTYKLDKEWQRLFFLSELVTEALKHIGNPVVQAAVDQLQVAVALVSKSKK